MSQTPAPPTPAVSEEDVLALLRATPDFFERHPDVLEHFELAHASGSAVSLIERQVEVLRGKNARLESRLARFIELARENEHRARGLHALARDLIRAPSLAALAAALRQGMRQDFDVDDTFIGISGTLLRRHDIEGVVPIDPQGTLYRSYENFFRTRLIECGPLPEAQAKLLFPKATVAILSAAIVPLEKEKSLGMMALGSRAADRFAPQQGKLFLEMTAELVSAAVRARLA
jgi:hypothetical protein